MDKSTRLTRLRAIHKISVELDTLLQGMGFISEARWSTVMDLARQAREHLPHLDLDLRYANDVNRARMVVRTIMSEAETEITDQANPVVGPTVGQRINELRNECRWTEEELAEEVDIDRTTVSRHIQNRMGPMDRFW